ncbi:MAG: glycosyltransferase [Armatimonadetes bacterium]|nr:glycosyltransferase [Armatimonadota bacterium]
MPLSPAAPARPCLGYVLPRYESRSAAHYAHIPRLLEQLSRWVDIEVAIWDCRDTPELPGVRAVHTLSAKGKLARWLELRRLLSRRAAAGVRRWFVRGSWIMATAAEAAGVETIYWNCGMNLPPVDWRERLGKILGRWALRHATFVGTAPGFEPYYQEQYGVAADKFVLLDNDIDPARFTPADETARAATRQRLGIPDGRRMLLFVHRLGHERGADFLLPLLAGCDAAGVEVTLVLVGPDGPLSGPLREHAASHPEQLVILGELPNHDLPALYAAADIFVHPSRLDGFPRVMLEAMASGTAVVTTQVGVVHVVLPPETHALALVPQDDVAGFTAKVVHLLTDEAARAGLAETLLERVQYYRTELVAERYAATLFPGSTGSPAPGSPARPRLLSFGKIVLRHPFANDQLNYALYQALLRYCDRIDVVGMSTRSEGHEEHLGALHIHGAPARPGIWGHWSYLAHVRRLLTRLQPPTVCWTSDALDGGLAALWAKRRFGVPMVVQVLGDYFALNPVRWSWVQRLVQAKLCAYTTRQADLVRSVAGRFVPDLTAHGVPPERILVMPMRVDMSLFEPGLHGAERAALRAEWGWDQHLVAVAVCTLNTTKGLDLLLQALADSLAVAPELRLALVGDGPQRAELEAQTARLGLGEHVTFAGFVQHRDVPRYLAAADLFVLSSRDEGLPRCVIEASAMGLPVIATDVGDVKEAVEDGETGLVVEPRAASLGAALRRMAALGADARRRMGERGRAHVVARFEFGANLETLARELLFPTPVELATPAEPAVAATV